MNAEQVRKAYDAAKARLDEIERRLDGENLPLAERRELEDAQRAAHETASAIWRSYSRVMNESKHVAEAERLAATFKGAVDALNKIDGSTLASFGCDGHAAALNGAVAQLRKLIATRQELIDAAVAKVESLLARRSPPPAARCGEVQPEAPTAA